jgi:hypothetical protein
LPASNSHQIRLSVPNTHKRDIPDVILDSLAKSESVAGDRQHVADARNKQRVVNIWRDCVALAIDQHRVAQALHEGVGALQHSLWRRSNDFHRAADKAGRADALEKQMNWPKRKRPCLKMPSSNAPI